VEFGHVWNDRNHCDVWGAVVPRCNRSFDRQKGAGVKMTKKQYRTQKETMTWVYLKNASDRSLGFIYSADEEVIDFEVDRLLEGMKALLCRAAALEGFVNAIGTQQCQEHWWNAVDRRSVTEKIQLLGKELTFSIDFGSEPFCHWKRIQKFRNRVVHPRRDKSREDIIDHDLDDGLIDYPEVDWEIECTDNLKTNCDAIDAMINKLQFKSNYRLEGTTTGRAIEIEDSKETS
jgi:hypothetical protein